MLFFGFLSSLVFSVENDEQHTPTKGRSTDKPCATALETSPKTTSAFQDISPNTGQYSCTSESSKFSEERFFIIYIALLEPGYGSGSNWHMTLSKRIVDYPVCNQMLGLLSEQKQVGNNRWILPCQISVLLRRYCESGLVSPSKDETNAFDVSPPLCRRWIRAAEQLSGQSGIAKLLKLIPDGSIGLENYPLCHTEQKRLARGEATPITYNACLIEVNEISQEYFREVLKKRYRTMDRLQQWIEKIDSFGNSDASVIPQLSADKSRAQKLFYSCDNETIYSLFKGAMAVIQKGKELKKAGKILYPTFFARHSLASTELKHISAHFFKNFYQELVEDDLLKASFVSAGPNIGLCHEIAQLWLTALKRELDSQTTVTPARQLFE